MEGVCHLLPQKSDSSGPSASGSGASPMISKGTGGEENNKQLTTGDNSLTFSNTNDQKISVNRASTESRIRRRPTTTPRAPQTSRFLSDPICLRRGGVRFRTTGCLQFSPYTERTVGVACNYIPTPQSENPLLDSAEIAWTRLPVTVELTLQEGTQTTSSKAEKRRDRKVPLAQLRRGPRRSNSDGFSRKTSSVPTPCTTTTTAPLRTRGKDTWSSTRRDARGKPLTAGTPRNYAAGGDVCSDFVVRRSSSNEKPTSHLFFSSGCGSNYVCSCCTHEELQPERARVLEVPPPGDTHLGSVASGQPRRGRGSLERIPLGRVAALKTELELWMHKEKQRTGRNRMKTAQPAAASGATNDEKEVLVQWQQTCSRTGESLHEGTDTATLMPGVDCKNAEGALRKQSARATETASRPALLACPSLLTSVECLSSRKAADNFLALYRSETSRSGACLHFGSAHPANQCSARSDNGIYHSRPCKEEAVFSNGTTQTTPVPKTKTLRQDIQYNTWPSKKKNADRPDKTRHRRRLTQVDTASSLESASPGVDSEPQKEITPALDLQNTQDLIHHETDGSLSTTRAETEEHTGAPAATPLTRQSHLTDRPLEGKTMPVEESCAPPFSRDVPGDQGTTICDSRGFSPRPSAEGCSADNELLCLSTAKTLARRPPHIPRLELAKVHELRDALYHPSLLSSSSKNSRFVPDSRLTSSRKPHAYPSIRTEHDREATAARMAKAYFEERPAGRCPIVKLVERPGSQDGLRQRQRSCLSQGFCLPARSRVVRCSPNLFTARVCTILRKQLHAEDVNAAGTRQHSQQAFNAPHPRNGKSIAADEREGSCSPAGKGVGKEAERDELFCAHHTIRKMLPHYHPSTMSQSEQFFAGCCNFNTPLTSYWFSPTRPPSSSSSVSRCSDPANAVATKEGEELGHSVPLKGEPVACVRSTSVCNIKAQLRPSRRLGGPRLSCGISMQHSKRRCHSSGQTSDQNSSRALNVRYKVSNGQPKERTIDRVGNSGRPAEESGRVKLCATEHILKKMCEGRSDRVQDRSSCHTLVPAFHRPLRRDHQGGKAATRDHEIQQPPANSTAVTFYKYGFAAGAATFMKRRRLALSLRKHSETGYYSDVAGKSLSAERPSAQVHGERTRMSFAHYTGANFF